MSGIRIHNRSVRAGEDDSFLRPRGNCDRTIQEQELGLSHDRFLLHPVHSFTH
jgi:hypothetical protein